MDDMADWSAARRDIEGGAEIEEVAARRGIAAKSLRARAARQDWGGEQTQRRRQRIVDMLLKAAARVVEAENAAEAERRAKALAAVASVAKAVREFDPKLAAACTGGDTDPEDLAAQRKAFDEEIERLIEARVSERVDAGRESA